MKHWFKRNKTQAPISPEELPSESVAESVPMESSSSSSFFSRLKQGLMKTRDHFGGRISRIFLGKKILDDDLLQELETILLTSDLGVQTTEKIIESLISRLGRKELSDSKVVLDTLRDELTILLRRSEQPLVLNNPIKPYVILMVGINGAGKTTTIGKLACKFKAEGKKVMLAAGDTFRAAAVEQLSVWGERNDIPVVAQATGADSASVIFDAFQSAKARDIDILIADTAGRLHTQDNLMEELKKIKRVMKKLDEHAPHEVMLVLDASIGQNALNQAKEFHDALGLTGITMTKLDGTAKGGILFAIANELNIPFRYIGIGENIEDLRDFSASQFVNALFEAP